MLLINYQSSAFVGLLYIQNNMHGIKFKINLDKLIVEENYLPEHIFNMDETSPF
jgi:hypothetical protein